MSRALVYFLCGERPGGLDYLYHQHEDDDSEDHNEVLIPVIAVIDRYLSESASSDNSRHRSIA